MINVIEVTAHGGPEVLKLAQRPDPVAGPDELVVRVHAANINPTDLGARQGFVIGEPPQIPYVLGWDYAGHVQSVGRDVHGFQVGDRVVGMIPWYATKGSRGAYAEAVAVKADWTVPLPEELDFSLACTLPLNALTAQQALALLGMAPQSELLITGASGAVGSFAVQLAVKDGHRVTAVAGREDEAWVESLGAERVLPRDTNYNTIGRFDWVLDAVPVGDSVLPAIADGGSVVTTRPTPKADLARQIKQQVVLIQSDKPALEVLVAEDSRRADLPARAGRASPPHLRSGRAQGQDHLARELRPMMLTKRPLWVGAPRIITNKGCKYLWTSG